jgi:hypothetical protein
VSEDGSNIEAKNGKRYADMFHRLVANTDEPENDSACWPWNGKKRCRFGYGRLNIYVPGLKRSKAFSAHVVMAILNEIGAESKANDIYLANLELKNSGLEIDHLCENTRCIHPDHLEPCTHQVNIDRRDSRYQKALGLVMNP